MAIKQLTEENIKNATTYIPLKLKSEMAKTYAEDCIEKVEVKYKDEILPPLYKENQHRRMLYGMLTLVGYYLNVIKEQDNFRDVDYDEWNGTSLLNQLNRFKSSKDSEVRDKAYDILDDYREFYRMLGGEINALLSAKNDLIYRATQYLDGKMTPEYFEKSLQDLRDVQEEAMEYINNRDKLFAEGEEKDSEKGSEIDGEQQ